MQLTDSDRSFGTVTRTFHWLTALLVLAVIPAGLVANGMAEDLRDPATVATQSQILRTAWVFSLHKTLGVCIFLVSLARIIWALTRKRPGFLTVEPRIFVHLARTVHWLLYGSLVMVPLTGWISHSAATGFAPIWWPFGQSLPWVPKDPAIAMLAGNLHIIFERVFVVSVLLHVAGALWHQFVDRDATLRRMWAGTANSPLPPAQPRTGAAPFAALAIWAAALLAGAGLGVFDDPAARSETAAPAGPAATGWQVTGGTISFEIQLDGNTLTGRFPDWSAEISPLETTTTGPAGTVTVIIDIASLTLGDVTDQALEADFLDIANFPVARFQGEIERDDTGYTLAGPLTIRDQTLPVSIPVTVEMDGTSAMVTGTLTLDRLDFGIGGALPDESVLGYLVDVAFDLTLSGPEPAE